MRPLFCDFCDFFVKKYPFFSKIADIRILPSKTPFSADLGMLMRTTSCTKCGYRGTNAKQTTFCVPTNPDPCLPLYFPVWSDRGIRSVSIVTGVHLSSFKLLGYNNEHRLSSVSNFAITMITGIQSGLGTISPRREDVSNDNNILTAL